MMRAEGDRRDPRWGGGRRDAPEEAGHLLSLSACAALGLLACSSRTPARDAAAASGQADLAAPEKAVPPSAGGFAAVDAGVRDEGAAGGKDASGESAIAPPSDAEGGDVPVDDADVPDASALAAEVRRMLRHPCRDLPPEEPPPVLDLGLRCEVPPVAHAQADEACARAWRDVQPAFSHAAQECSRLLLEHRSVEARRRLRSWFDQHACPASCDPPFEVVDLARRIELCAGAEETLAERGAWLARPVRAYVRGDGLSLRVRPADDAPASPVRVAAVPDRVLDVWAAVPEGWLLVADPFRAPRFAVWDPPEALLGWVRACRLSAEPQGTLAVDVGHPVPILRPAGMEQAQSEERGTPCTVAGKPGLYFVLWPDERGSCFEFREMCGGLGVTPPSWDFPGPDEEVCMDCCTLGRSMVAVGDFCRAREPGWTWQCSSDNMYLVCKPP